MDALDVLLEQFDDRIQMISQAVARGSCKDIEEYRFTCGQLRGLEAASTLVKDLKTRLETSDE